MARGSFGTNEEIQIVKDYYPTEGEMEVFQRLGMTRDLYAIRRKASLLGIKVEKRKRGRIFKNGTHKKNSYIFTSVN